MTDREQLDYILAVLKITADNDAHDNIIWHVEDDTARFVVNCSDLFEWGCADGENVTPANVNELARAFADARAAHPSGKYVGAELFAARQRGMRPQGAAYPPSDARELWPLFDACGPERPVSVSNPCKSGASSPANSYITHQPGVCMGRACVRNRRLPVGILVAQMQAGVTDDDLLASYPRLTLGDLGCVRWYAAGHPEEIERDVRRQEGADAAGE